MKSVSMDMPKSNFTPLAPIPSDTPRRLSRVFAELARAATGPVSVEEIRQALGDRSFATLFVFFACINLLPFPPGSTLVLGIPLLLISWQMVMGNHTVWLPRFVLSKSLGADKFRTMSEKLIPRLEWLERLIRPRYWPFERRRADRIIGLIALFFAIAVTLPIPFGNWFPALTCALIGLALSERDGILLGAAIACGLFSMGLIAIVVGMAAMAGKMIIG